MVLRAHVVTVFLALGCTGGVSNIGSEAPTQSSGVSSTGSAVTTYAARVDRAVFSAFDLNAGDSVTRGNLTLVMQKEGNLVLYRDITSHPVVLWSEGVVTCAGNCFASFQREGNLVLYNRATGAYWANTSETRFGNRLVLSTTPPFISIENGGQVIWAGPSGLRVDNDEPCFSVNYAQFPSNPNLFLGRRNRSNDCNVEASYYLSLNVMNWSAANPTLTFSHVVFDPRSNPDGGADLEGGTELKGGPEPVLGAYDPSIAEINGVKWVAFECNSRTLVSACIGPLDGNNVLDIERTVYVIKGGSTFAAGVPKIFTHQGHIYLYWSTITFPETNHHSDVWISGNIRGVELGFDPLGSGRLFAIGRSTAIEAIDPSTVEVFGVDPTDPRSNKIADAYQAVSIGNYVYLTTAKGGGKCIKPDYPNEGCFRGGIARTQDPLGYHAFNAEQSNETLWPGNPSNYAHLVRVPSGGYQVLVFLSQNRGKASSRDLPMAIYLLPIPTEPFFLDATFAASNRGVMSRDGVYPASVVMENSGLLPWYQTEGFKLGAVKDSSIWGLNRIEMYQNEVVMPGATKTFAFNVVAPAQPDTTHFQWRMVQEGVTWFGETSADQTTSMTATLNAFSLYAGQSIVRGNLRLIMQSEGNLVLYQNAGTAQVKVLWASSNAGPNGSDCKSWCWASFQNEGNLVLYQGASPYWATSSDTMIGNSMRISTAKPYITILNGSNVVWSGR